MSGVSGQNFADEKDDFKLEEKVTRESEGIRLLCKLTFFQAVLRTGFPSVVRRLLLRDNRHHAE